MLHFQLLVSVSGSKGWRLRLPDPDELGRNMPPIHKDIHVQTAQVPPQALDVPLIGMCPPAPPRDEACRVCLRHVRAELTREWPEPVQP